MNAVVALEPRPKSVTLDMADKFGMEPRAFEQTLRATVFPSNAPPEEFAAFLLVAKQYDLNPITKEIYAFPKKGGGIVPIVSIDGWMKLINSNPKFDGMEFEDAHAEKGDLISTKCTIHRKDRAHPVSITEYLDECVRPTEPWKMKHRMLRHKAAIQCARYAFGFAGIYEEDEAERIAGAHDVTPKRVAPPPPPAPQIEHRTTTPAVEDKPQQQGPYHRGMAVLLTEGRGIAAGGRRPFDQWWNALIPAERGELKSHMPELMKLANEANQAARRAPPSPTAAAAAPPIDSGKLQEQFANALAFADSEDSANAAYTMIVGPVESSIPQSDLDALLRMLNNRVCEITP